MTSFKKDNVSNRNFYNVSYSDPLPPAATDTCLPLLKTIRRINPDTVAVRAQRPAGNTAALGFVLGVRFALGPVEHARSSRSRSPASFNVWQPLDVTAGDHAALAVSAYRQCQKDRALAALRER